MKYTLLRKVRQMKTHKELYNLYKKTEEGLKELQEFTIKLLEERDQLRKELQLRVIKRKEI